MLALFKLGDIAVITRIVNKGFDWFHWRILEKWFAPIILWHRTVEFFDKVFVPCINQGKWICRSVSNLQFEQITCAKGYVDNWQLGDDRFGFKLGLKRRGLRRFVLNVIIVIIIQHGWIRSPGSECFQSGHGDGGDLFTR